MPRLVSHAGCHQQAERVVVQQMPPCPPQPEDDHSKCEQHDGATFRQAMLLHRLGVAPGLVEVVARTQDSAARQCQQTVF